MKHLTKYQVISVVIGCYFRRFPHGIASAFPDLSDNLSLADSRHGHSAPALICVPRVCEQHQIVMQSLGNLGHLCPRCEAEAAERLRVALLSIPAEAA